MRIGAENAVRKRRACSSTESDELNGPPMNSSPLVSLQSHVAFGYVGNAVAVPALQALGQEVWPLNSVSLSNHKGYGDWQTLAEPLNIAAALASLRVRLDWPKTGLLSGYLASAAQVRALAAQLEQCPPAFYLLDPVLGDEGPGLYVDPALVPVYRDLLAPRAQAVCLNYFEFCTLTGCEGPHALPSALAAWAPPCVLVTSVPCAAGLALWGKEPGGLWRLATPKLVAKASPMPNGLGDLASALMAHGFMRGQAMPELMAGIANRLFALLEASLAQGRRELDLVGQPALLIEPPARFSAEAVSG